jgi:hypothetical protein
MIEISRIKFKGILTITSERKQRMRILSELSGKTKSDTKVRRGTDS